ncbi:fasciclin domain-containing protein [Candidatus Pelagibacter sp.]|nr:fasciclin domain-containing protein [Candidatus Pelagibacter sp.]
MKKIYLFLSFIIMIFVPSITFGNVIDKLNEAGKFNKLNETLSKSGLNENLKGAGPFTVFAPLDDAFAAISAQTYYGLLRDENKDKLVNILGRHVFSKKINSSEIDGEIKLKAINGEEITIKKVNGIVYINEAEVVTADVEVSNGVIHYINRVLQPLK